MPGTAPGQLALGIGTRRILDRTCDPRCTLHGTAQLGEHFNPKFKREVCTLGIPQLPAQFIAVSLLKDCAIKSRTLCESPVVFAIVVLVATQLRQGEVVFLECPDSQVTELSGIHINQSLFVSLGNISDSHDVDVDSMLLGEQTTLATDSLHVCDVRCAADLNDVDVGGRAGQAVVLRDHEATEAVNLCRPRELRIDVAEE